MTVAPHAKVYSVHYEHNYSSLFLLPFILPSRAINVIRLALSDFDSA